MSKLCPSLWKEIRAKWDVFVTNVHFEVGEGDEVHFLHDRWCGEHLLKEQTLSCMADEDELVFAYLVGGTNGGEVH